MSINNCVIPDHWEWLKTEDKITIHAECDKDCQDPECPYIHVSQTYDWCDNCNRYHAENETCDWWHEGGIS